MASVIRLYVDQAMAVQQQINLSAEQAHYVNNVMRLKAGDPLSLFNGRDGEFSATLLNGHKKNALVQLENRTREQDSCPDLTLVFAPIKKQRLDFIIEKATELGVRTLQPVLTQRTITSKIRIERLQAQTVEAAEQCERLNIPDVHEAVSLSQLMKDWRVDCRVLVLNEHGGSRPIHEVLQEAQPHETGSWAIFVGPEGGFTSSELDLMLKLPNVEAVSIGPRILRADTAALAAISCWQSVLGDWQSPLRERINKEE